MSDAGDESRGRRPAREAAPGHAVAGRLHLGVEADFGPGHGPPLDSCGVRRRATMRRASRRNGTTRCRGASSSGVCDGDAELHRLLDEVVGDARAGEGDDAPGQQVQELVVAPERCGASVAVQVRPAHHLVHAVALGPLRGDAFDAGEDLALTSVRRYLPQQRTRSCSGENRRLGIGPWNTNALVRMRDWSEQ